jgi:hypothetical protein
MLPFLKKKSEVAAVSEMPPWHPNLRNVARLPDTKVVRTSFFVNGAAIFITIGILLWFSYQEYQLHNLNRQIAYWQTQIDRDQKESDRFIAMYGKFQAEQARINEVNAFVHSKPTVSKLLMHLAQTLPAEIALDSFLEQATGVTLHCTVKGTPDEASGYATAYLDQLRADTELAVYFGEVAYSGSGVARNPQTGRLSLQLFLKFGPSAKGGKK